MKGGGKCSRAITAVDIKTLGWGAQRRPLGSRTAGIALKRGRSDWLDLYITIKESIAQRIAAVSSSASSFPPLSLSIRINMAAGPSPAVQAWSLKTSFLSESEKQHVHPEKGTETWKRTKRLGAGGFGDVWHEECTSGTRAGQVRAVKQIIKRPDMMQLLSRELDILVGLSTDAGQPEYLQYFVEFHGWFADDMHLYIAMEYLPYGDLQSHIGQPFAEQETATIISQVAKALECMHQKGIVHRDLKPANILVASPRPSWHVKITDFGISKNVKGTALKTKVGTDAYMAPELFESGPLSARGYTSAVDIWGLGAIAYCIQTGRPPFSSAYDIFMFKTDKKEFPTAPLWTTSGAFAFFIQSLMAKQPESRPTINQVLSHQWITSLGRITPAIPQNAESETNVWDAQASAAWNTSISMPEARTIRPRPVSTEAPSIQTVGRTVVQPIGHKNNTFKISASELVIPPYSRQTPRREDSGYHEQATPEPAYTETSTAKQPSYQDTMVQSQRKRQSLNQVDSGYHETSTPSQPTRDSGKKPWSKHLNKNPYHTCLTCGLRFDDRDELFEHIEAQQHGVDLETLQPEPYARPSWARREPEPSRVGEPHSHPTEQDQHQVAPNLFDLVDYESPRSAPKLPKAGGQGDKVLKYSHKDPFNNCLMCGKHFPGRNQLFSHIAAENHYVDPKTFKAEPVEPARPAATRLSRSSCLTCGEHFESRNQLFDHIRRRGHGV
ncbi:hypothetical protein DL765_010951 [Monosporascus sp. GIB2]|nr:hypothetical protein DL765_010951 [Monosporascus sp. GIB2]